MKNYFELPLSTKVLEHMYLTGKKPLQILAVSNWIFDFIHNDNIESVTVRVCEYGVTMIKCHYRSKLIVKVELL